MRKNKHWIVLLSLALVLIVLGVLAWHQRNNLRALAEAGKYNSDELQSQMELNRQELQNVIDALEGVTVREPTAEEKEALQSGSMTAEELADALTKPNPQRPLQDPQTQLPDMSEAEPSQTEQPQSEYERQLSLLLAEAYVMREQYTTELDEMAQKAVAEYRNGIRHKSNSEKLDWAGAYLTQAGELEQESDARMDDLVIRLRKLLKENGQPLDLLEQVVDAYASEKSLKKAYYISELKTRGLV